MLDTFRAFSRSGGSSVQQNTSLLIFNTPKVPCSWFSSNLINSIIIIFLSSRLPIYLGIVKYWQYNEIVITDSIVLVLQPTFPLVSKYGNIETIEQRPPTLTASELLQPWAIWWGDLGLESHPLLEVIGELMGVIGINSDIDDGFFGNKDYFQVSLYQDGVIIFFVDCAGDFEHLLTSIVLDS